MNLSRPLLRYGGYFASITTARIVGTLISAGTFPYLVHRLGVDIYGLWSYVVAFTGFTSLIANPGLTTYAGQQVAAHREKAFQTVSDVMLLRLLGSIVAVAAVFVAASFETRPDTRLLLRLYGTASVLTTWFGVDYVLVSFEMFHFLSVLSLVQQSLYAIGIFALVRSPRDVLWVPISILASSLVSVTFAWVAIWQKGFRWRLEFAPERWRTILVPSFHYAASSLMSTAYHRTGHLAVRWYLGEHALGIYAAATRLADILRNFLVISQTVVMPKMALRAQSPETLGRLTRVAASFLVLLGVPLVAGGFITATALVPWLLGTQFQDAVSAFRWTSPYLLTAPAATLFAGTVLYATARHRAYLVSTSAGAVAAVILFLALPPLFGIPGACLAFVMGELSVAGTAFALCPPEVRRAVDLRMVGLALLGSAFMVAVLRAAMGFQLRPVVFVTVGAVAYLLFCMVFGRNLLRTQLKTVT